MVSGTGNGAVSEPEIVEKAKPLTSTIGIKKVALPAKPLPSASPKPARPGLPLTKPKAEIATASKEKSVPAAIQPKLVVKSLEKAEAKAAEPSTVTAPLSLKPAAAKPPPSKLKSGKILPKIG